MHAISSYRGNRHRPPATNTHKQDRLQYTASLSLARSVTRDWAKNKHRSKERHPAALRVTYDNAAGADVSSFQQCMKTYGCDAVVQQRLHSGAPGEFFNDLWPSGVAAVVTVNHHISLHTATTTTTTTSSSRRTGPRQRWLRSDTAVFINFSYMTLPCLRRPTRRDTGYF